MPSLTMDGTASLVYLAAAKEAEAGDVAVKRVVDHGAIVRGDSSVARIALVFTGHEFIAGASSIVATLEKEKAKASFFYREFFEQYPIGACYRDDDKRRTLYRNPFRQAPPLLRLAEAGQLAGNQNNFRYRSLCSVPRTKKNRK